VVQERIAAQNPPVIVVLDGDHLHSLWRIAMLVSAPSAENMRSQNADERGKYGNHNEALDERHAALH
jgi:hypothetical protein